MARRSASGVLLWLLVAVIALIGYGSLYPFHFVFDGSFPTPAAALAQLRWARAGRADQVRNVLLYVPLGFCLLLWWRGRMHVLWATLLATLSGAALSFIIELAQVYLTVRVPSWLDLSLNTMGALLGAITGSLWRRLTALVYLPAGTRQAPGDPSAWIVVLSWVVWRLSTFDLHLTLVRLKQALLPLLDWQFAWLPMLEYLLLWMVVAQAVYGLTSRQRSHEGLLAVMGVVLAGRLMLVTPAFSPAELVALLLLLPALVLLHRVRGGAHHGAVLAMFAVYFVINQLAPWQFTRTDHTFDLWPFLSWMAEGMPFELTVWSHKVFLFSALIWLCKDIGLRLVTAGVLVTALVFVLEVVQLWQASHTSSLTNPVLAGLIAYLMVLVSHEQRRPARLRYR